MGIFSARASGDPDFSQGRGSNGMQGSLSGADRDSCHHCGMENGVAPEGTVRVPRGAKRGKMVIFLTRTAGDPNFFQGRGSNNMWESPTGDSCHQCGIENGVALEETMHGPRVVKSGKMGIF